MYDTPGMHGSRDFKTRSHAMRVAATWTNVVECDMLAFIVDGPKQLGEFATRHVAELAVALGSPEGPGAIPGWKRLPVVLLLNKVDQIGRPRMKEVRRLCAPVHRVDFAACTASMLQKTEGS